MAVGFWIHAVYATHLITFPAHLRPSISHHLVAPLLIILICYYSFFGENGWYSVLSDILYIYFWPCIFLAKRTWQIVKYGYKFVRARVVVTSPDLITRRLPQQPVIESPKNEPKPEPPKPTFISRSIRPFSQFILLWAMVILATNNRVLIVISTAITLLGATIAIYRLWDLMADASSWIEKLKGDFARQIATNVGRVRAWEEVSDLEEITKAANALKMLEAIFTFIADNKKFLARATTILAGFTSVAFYCYISFLFSCVYAGMAKVQGISWPWSAAFVDSLYIPFAFTNLPNNIPIQFMGGLQAVAITLIGWNIFFRHLNSRFERIAVAASELRGSFEDKVLRVKLTLIQQQAALSSTTTSTPTVLSTVAGNAENQDPSCPIKDVLAARRNGFRQKRQKQSKPPRKT